MFDRTRVASGFDIEALLSERYLTYIILAQIEAGRLDSEFEVVNTDSGTDLQIILHPPTDYNVLYREGESPDLPEQQPDSFLFELLSDDADAFMHIKVIVTVVDRANNKTFAAVPAGLLMNIALESETADNGLENNHELVLQFVRFDDFTRAAISTASGIDPETVEAQFRPFVDRRIPLGIARGQRVQRLRIKKHVTGAKRSLGIYLDLALRTGPEPENYLEPRGNLALAQDFREAGTEVAFSTSPGLFSLAGPDIKFRQAEKNKNGSFSFPLRKNPQDPNSEVIGRIKNVTVGPHILRPPNQPSIATGELVIDLHGEYTDAVGDPDFHLLLLINPKATDGIVELDFDVHVNLGLLATLLLVAVGIGLTVLFAPGLAWGSTVIAGSLIGLAVLRGIVAQPLAAKLIEDRIDDEETEASILDVLPFRLPAARRRWDPFYVTEHQVVSLVDTITIDEQGFAFDATDLVLDKEPVPVNHVVIRDKQLSGNQIAALRYRVADFTRIADDLEATAPGQDRMAFSRSDPDNEPTLVDLTLEQIAERIDTGRILAPITYTPERIHLVNNQIDHILTISRRERGEAERRLINQFRNEQREILLNVFSGLEQTIREDLENELGRPPTDDEVEDAIDEFLDPVLDSMQAVFEKSELPPLLEEEVLRHLRFELAPEQYVTLQNAGILIIDGKEIIIRRNKDGTTTPYFRDHPDADPKDNLLALPTYSPPFAATE